MAAEVIDLNGRRPKAVALEGGYAEERTHGEVGVLRVVSMLTQQDAQAWVAKVWIKSDGIADSLIVSITASAERTESLEQDAATIAETVLQTLRIARAHPTPLLYGDD
ncbi:hypothetical protein [Methylobacterium sp. Leaf117]|uniref:hypothetical protein n=1 Tax=Methylobacterium sp. Leaf117 TaxID=1736260 RepID=UPI0006FF6EB8|nr:hypothetical protein [Methylobacterium sp. Leaf117]KQP91544.1 hypothetical protein ASF57_23015 [Methylobacterium sp. Leaf117]